MKGISEMVSQIDSGYRTEREEEREEKLGKRELRWKGSWEGKDAEEYFGAFVL